MSSQKKQPPSAAASQKAAPAGRQQQRQPAQGPSTASQATAAAVARAAPPASPPYSASPPTVAASDSKQTGPGEDVLASHQSSLASATSSTLATGPARPNYAIALHSVRITKHGFAIDPLELKYPEISNKLSPIARRLSASYFEPTSVGHKVLALIRGFWSQPGFPKGRLVKPSDSATLESILADFRKRPNYPHKNTVGAMCKTKLPAAREKSNRSRRGPAKQLFVSLVEQQPTQASKQTKTSPSTSAGKKPQSASFSVASHRSQDSLTSLSSASTTTSASHSTSSEQTFFDWIPKNKDLVAELVTDLCQQVEALFSAEPRIINISSPCTVLGDIHGNLPDLRAYEHSLWPKAPVCNSCNYLFLGDYVDRGDYSVECILYLFSMKLIAPKQFYLLRGNHEVAQIQLQYTFSSECDAKFGSAGRQLWRRFNKVFDVMPIGAIIDEQIFCAHGGIPRSATDVRQLSQEIPTPLNNPEVQSPPAWEIMWNDPITDSELVTMLEMDGSGSVVAQTHTVPTAAAATSAEPTADSAPTKAATPSARFVPALPASNVNVPPPPPQADAATAGKAQERTRGTSSALATSAETAGALSFYIRPASEQTAPTSSSARLVNVEQPKRPTGSATNGNDALRTVPSDTSSVASASEQQILNDGFVANIKRGTAFLFSDQAINNFLKVNKLSFVIRAHEVIPTGFAFHGDGRVITIFSSSKYCGLNNQAACALVDKQRIRILRMDTGDAGE